MAQGFFFVGGMNMHRGVKGVWPCRCGPAGVVFMG